MRYLHASRMNGYPYSGEVTTSDDVTIFPAEYLRAPLPQRRYSTQEWVPSSIAILLWRGGRRPAAGWKEGLGQTPRRQLLCQHRYVLSSPLLPDKNQEGSTSRHNTRIITTTRFIILASSEAGEVTTVSCDLYTECSVQLLTDFIMSSGLFSI